MNNIFPVIMAGDYVTRLWPLSRTVFPKQFLSLGNDKIFCSKRSLALMA